MWYIITLAAIELRKCSVYSVKDEHQMSTLTWNTFAVFRLPNWVKCWYRQKIVKLLFLSGWEETSVDNSGFVFMLVLKTSKKIKKHPSISMKSNEWLWSVWNIHAKHGPVHEHKAWNHWASSLGWGLLVLRRQQKCCILCCVCAISQNVELQAVFPAVIWISLVIWPQ